MIDFAKYLNQPPSPPPKVPDVVIAVTGHRPPKIGGYHRDNPLRTAIRERMRAVVADIVATVKHSPDDRMRAMHLDSYLRRVTWRKPRPELGPLGITGMALGVDQDFAGVLVRMGIPFVAVVPFPGQESVWPAESQRIYRKILDEYATGVVYVSDVRSATTAEASEKLLARNEWLVCAADELVSVWDGSSGGTAVCVRYWRKCGGPMNRNIDPREITGGMR